MDRISSAGNSSESTVTRPPRRETQTESARRPTPDEEAQRKREFIPVQQTRAAPLQPILGQNIDIKA